MSVWVILPLIASFFNLLLIALVLRSNPRAGLNRILSLFLLVLAVWALAVFSLRMSATLAEALPWQKLALAVGPLGAVLYYHFTLRLTRASLHRTYLLLAYELVILITLLAPSDLIVSGNQMKFYGPAPLPGPFFFAYITIMYALVFLGVRNLVLTIRTSPSHKERNRANYVILGTLCFLGGGITDFLPVLGLRIYPLGIIGNLLFSFFAVVAIVRHQLLDIRFMARKGLAYVVFIAFVVGIYIDIILMISGTRRVPIWTNVVLITLLAVSLQIVLARVQRLVDRVFYRHRYDYIKALEQFSHQTQSIADLDSLCATLVNTIALALEAKNVYLLLPSPPAGDFTVHAASVAMARFSIAADSPFIGWIKRSDQLLTSRDLNILPQFQGLRLSEKAFLKMLSGEIYLPLKGRAGVAGILVLVARPTGRPYSGEDIAMLWAISRQAAVSLENAHLYAQENARLEQAEKLEQMKSDFMVKISHQLKTPLTSLRAAVDILAEEEARNPSPVRLTLVRTMGLGIDSLQRLISRILDLAKIQTATLELHRQPVDLAALVEETAAMMAPALALKKQTLSLELPDALQAVAADGQRLEQVLVNLVENASKFTGREGRITVRVKELEDTGVVVEVEDSGPGIPENEQKRIFEPYYQVKMPGSDIGNGLGLAIVKSLIELHGGRVWVESQVGTGSTFSFLIPSRSDDNDNKEKQ